MANNVYLLFEQSAAALQDTTALISGGIQLEATTKKLGFPIAHHFGVLG